MSYSSYSILLKKRDGGILEKDEIKWFIDGFTAGSVADYQMAAFLMAVCTRGMNEDETAALTDAMLYSGDVLTFEETAVVDKHSTGGVGDKTSFILAPLAAACGITVPMIAGRGLGHTGGTVDKAESIKGFNTEITLKEFENLLKTKKLAMIGQTPEIAPADKKIYALRDVTATIESVPLITGSIMSKKLAEGARGIVMDIKVGNGAFMKNLEEARVLANSLMNTAERFDRHMVCMLTNMNEPLGNTIGNSLEIIECIDVLKGCGPKDLTELSLELAGSMVHIGGKAKTHEEGVAMVTEAMNNGSGLKVFKEMLENQGGLSDVVEDYSLLPQAKCTTEVPSPCDGFVKEMATRNIGLHCVDLGGGRHVAEDKIDFGVGFTIHKKVGDKVNKGESLLTIHHNDDQTEIVERLIKEFTTVDYSFSETEVKADPLIYEKDIRWSK
ncbi:MAG: thymidine phosphorylase [Halobacteriovorax sp.]|nr:thymidine phosphorylase [Halobacteriovorax sp.]|tara:strand:- start:79268 stop:80593 length:1326 start_codon:yes stop_codon:yes gene_type:complete